MNKEYEKLDARVGLLGHKALLTDYSKTLEHLDALRIGQDAMEKGPLTIGGEKEEGDVQDRGSSTDEKWNDRRHLRQQDGGMSSGGGIGSEVSSVVSSANERDDESSN